MASKVYKTNTCLKRVNLCVVWKENEQFMEVLSLFMTLVSYEKVVNVVMSKL